MIEIGQKAPDFTLPNSNGEMVTLSSFEGKKNVVLIMYPGDNTPTCSIQLKSVRDNYQDFETLQTIVLGINHENAASHNSFIEQHDLKNPLLVDEGRKVIEQYDALITDEAGNPQTNRSVIIIDKAGIIQYINRGNPPHEEIKDVLEKINH